MDERGQSREIDADALLAQSGWVSALARGLVHDRAAAEDAVQETWLAALRHAPREPGRLRPWLAHVLANVARKQRRGDTHRAEREAHAARREGLPSAGDVAAKLEAQRLLVSALDSLEEPYKTTIVLRYLDGIDSAEIARRANVPAGTVRWRLKEGLDRLRMKLDADAHGDRATWAIAFAPFVPPPALSKLAASALAASPGVVIMSALSRGTWIAAAVVLAALGVYVWNERSEHDAGGVTAHASEVALTPSDVASTPGRPPLETLELREPALGMRTNATSADADAPGVSVITGRVVDELRRPLAGVSLALVDRAPATGGAGPATDPLGAPTEPGVGGADRDNARSPIARSESDGRFRITLADGTHGPTVELTARGAGYTTRVELLHLEPGRTHELGELVLARAAIVRGRVLYAGGEPCSGARVRSVPAEHVGELERVRRFGPGPDLHCAETVSLADGSFEIRDAPPGVARVCAGLDGFFWSASELLELASSRTVDGVELVLAPLDGRGHIGGRVLAPDGTPVAGAQISYGYRYAHGSSYSSVFSAEDGSFRLDLKHLVPHTLSAHDPRERWQDVGARTTPPGADSVVLQFVESRTCRVIARDPSGAPAGAIALTTLLLASDGKPVNFGGERSVARVDTAPPGETSFQIPLQRFLLRVEARGFQLAELGPFEPENAPSELACTLVPRPGVHGRVFADGRPVAGAKLELHALAGGHYIERNGFLTRLHPDAAERAVSAEDGSFALDPGASDDYALLCDAPGFATSEIALGRVELATGLADVEVALGRGGAIEGRVLVPPGADPAGVIVAFDRHDARARTLRADRDGRYRLDGLTPGAWYVARGTNELLADDDEQTFGEFAPGGVEYPVSCTVADGETTVFDLDLRHGAAAELLAHVTLDGQPAVGWKLLLVPDDPRHLRDDAYRAAIDGRGDARIVVPETGPCTLELSSSAESGAELVFHDRIELLAGPNAWTFAVERGSVKGHITPERAAKWRHDLVWQLSECDVRIAITPDAEGRFTLPFVPAGTWAVLTSAKNTFGEGGAAPPVVVTVKRGETAEVVLE